MVSRLFVYAQCCVSPGFGFHCCIVCLFKRGFPLLAGCVFNVVVIVCSCKVLCSVCLLSCFQFVDAMGCAIIVLIVQCCCDCLFKDGCRFDLWVGLSLLLCS
jgi:hypothetical protein